MAEPVQGSPGRKIAGTRATYSLTLNNLEYTMDIRLPIMAALATAPLSMPDGTGEMAPRRLGHDDACREQKRREKSRKARKNQRKARRRNRR